MAKRCTARNIAGSVARNAVGFDGDGFRLINHGSTLAQAHPLCEGASLIVERNIESALIIARHLIGVDI